eukprot:TRINITY_DN20126_c0_g2_i1.p1 TRINITY_DN20126_c0_g2~~TRINITY_DN20126_c0_g2_i1.p1  ORF type:complete len:510 (-),score=75.06 TRINITY_DN20126_c0_g2_i1:116-1624(-)
MPCSLLELLFLLATFAWAGGSSAASSPCKDRYAPWLTKRAEFVRKDEAPVLEGLHLVCVWRSGDSIELEAHRNGVEHEQPLREALPTSTDLEDWAGFRKALGKILQIRKETNKWGNFHLKQPFGIFAESGQRLASAGEMLEAGLVLIFEGGQWFWPPVELGFVRQLAGTPYELETMSVQPVVFRVRGFLQIDECDKIIMLGSDSMVESPVTPMDTAHKDTPTKQFRTSTQARLESSKSSMLQSIDYRISNLTRVPVSHNEEVQVLRYNKGQFYQAHSDNFDPQYYIETADFIDKGHRNRLLTVFWYLSNVSAGGETIFPRAYGLPTPQSMASCEKGLKVRPEVGTVIFWYSLRPNGNSDPNGLHAACPVEEGQKWSANYWVWNKPRSGNEPMPDWGLDGEAESGGTADPVEVQIHATFKNSNSANKIYLFWKNPASVDEVPMGEIPPSSSVGMNTYSGHVWHIRTGPDQSSELVAEKVIEKGKLKQVFSVGDSRSKPHDEEL